MELEQSLRFILSQSSYEMLSCYNSIQASLKLVSAGELLKDQWHQFNRNIECTALHFRNIYYFFQNVKVNSKYTEDYNYSILLKLFNEKPKNNTIIDNSSAVSKQVKTIELTKAQKDGNDSKQLKQYMDEVLNKQICHMTSCRYGLSMQSKKFHIGDLWTALRTIITCLDHSLLQTQFHFEETTEVLNLTRILEMSSKFDIKWILFSMVNVVM